MLFPSEDLSKFVNSTVASPEWTHKVETFAEPVLTKDDIIEIVNLVKDDGGSSASISISEYGISGKIRLHTDMCKCDEEIESVRKIVNFNDKIYSDKLKSLNFNTKVLYGLFAVLILFEIFRATF